MDETLQLIDKVILLKKKTYIIFARGVALTFYAQTVEDLVGTVNYQIQLASLISCVSVGCCSLPQLGTIVFFSFLFAMDFSICSKSKIKP